MIVFAVALLDPADPDAVRSLALRHRQQRAGRRALRCPGQAGPDPDLRDLRPLRRRRRHPPGRQHQFLHRPTWATFYELNAIAAVVIGGAALSGGRGTVRGTIIGAFVIGFLANGLVIVGVSPFWQKVITGAVIILAVAVDQIQQIVQRRRGPPGRDQRPRRAETRRQPERPRPAVHRPDRPPHRGPAASRTGAPYAKTGHGPHRADSKGRPCSDRTATRPCSPERRCSASRLRACGGSSGEPAASAPASASAGGGAAGGTIAIITVDPSNPYWKTEADIAKAEAEKLGYKTTVSANKNDPETQNQLIETAINDKVTGILLDPAGADESVAAVQKAVDANIPVVLINAEIAKTGLAKAQIVSNNAQGATVGAEEWAKAMDYKGTYVELFGKPSDNNAQVRSDGYEGVISQYPDLKQVGKEIANWDRQRARTRWRRCCRKNPDVKGVIAGNDEMALGRDQRAEGQGQARRTSRCSASTATTTPPPR